MPKLIFICLFLQKEKRRENGIQRAEAPNGYKAVKARCKFSVRVQQDLDVDVSSKSFDVESTISGNSEGG